VGCHGGGSGGGISADGGGSGAGEGDRSEEGCCTGAATVLDPEASNSGSSGGGSTGRFRGRPPAFLEGTAPTTLVFLALCIVTPLPYLGMVLSRVEYT
jgi:hypothetical protein